MCARSLWGLLDRRRVSVVDDVLLAWRWLGPPWPLSVSSWKTTRRAAGGGVRLRAGSGQGSLSPGAVPACRLASLRCEDCLGTSAGRTIGGGFCTCQRGNPLRVVAPGGVPGSYGEPPGWGAPGPLGTVAAGGLRCALGSPGIQGCPRCCAFAWLHGCAGLRVGAIASVVRSFGPGCRRPYAP